MFPTVAPDTGLRSFNRFELKYLVGRDLVPTLCAELAERLDRDRSSPHGTYTVWSRYYDTRDLRFYWDLSVVEVKVNERVPTWLTDRIARHKSQVVKVQVPPDEDYTARLDEAFARHTSRSELVSLESIRGGALPSFSTPCSSSLLGHRHLSTPRPVDSHAFLEAFQRRARGPPNRLPAPDPECTRLPARLRESPLRYASRISRPNASDPEEHAEAWQESLWMRGAADGEINAASKPVLAPVARIHPVPPTESPGRVRPKAASSVRAWPALDELLTPNDVMAILKVADLRTARRYMQLAGGFRLGREYRIRRQALLSWIENRELDADRPASEAQTRTRRPRADPADWRARIRAAAR